MRGRLVQWGLGATGLGAAVLAAFAIAAPNTGKLTFVQAKIDAVDLAGVNDLEACRDGRNLYVASFDAGTLVSFERKQGSGRLQAIDVETDGDNVADMTGPGDVVCSPDGDFVYVTSDGDEAILAFARNGRTGKLRFKHRETDSEGRLGSVYGLTDSPDGEFLYATASETDDNLLTYHRNARSGKLVLRDVETGDVGLDGAGTPRVAADGANLYVAGSGDDAVATYDRNTRTGKLSFVNAKVDDTGDIDGLGGAYSLAVARDGRNLYVTSDGESAIASFKRNRRNGKLTFLDARFDEAEAGDFFATPYDVIVSRDGRNVYVGVYGDDSVTVFKRKPSGRLRFIQAKVGAIDSATTGPYRMELTRDDRHLYSGNYDEDGIVVFKRKLP